MVMVLFAQAAVTPEGKPEAGPISLAPVVLWVIFVKVLLIHNNGLKLAMLTVLSGFTVTSTVNGVPEQPVGVTVYLTTPAVVVVLVNVCAIGPVIPVL